MFGWKLVFMLVNGLLQVMIDYFTFTIKMSLVHLAHSAYNFYWGPFINEVTYFLTPPCPLSYDVTLFTK